MAVFCIICSPIHVMLCKSELKVDGCNLRGSLAYVYLRSSFVHSEDKAQSREPGACKRRAGPECGLSVWPSAHHPPPGLCPLAQRGDTDWSSASIQARGVSARPLTPRHSLPQNGEWGGALEFQRLFWGGTEENRHVYVLSPDISWLKISEYRLDISGQLSSTSCFKYFTHWDSFTLFETLTTSSNSLNLKRESS